jgi:hypothetical protein
MEISKRRIQKSNVTFNKDCTDKFVAHKTCILLSSVSLASKFWLYPI